MQSQTERLPLSYAQQRLWFLYRMEVSRGVYNIPLALRLAGALDQQAMEMALGDVVTRHESLRTVLREDDGIPYQCILPVSECGLKLPVEEVSETELPERLASAAVTEINLECEIPLRVWLFRLSSLQHVLMLVLHHVAGDGWSLDPLARDLAQAYAARRQGSSPLWPELAVQYADYTLWQRELLGDESEPESLLSRR